nr:hypothetical protein [uncultured Cohaesibacter sp.]
MGVIFDVIKWSFGAIKGYFTKKQDVDLEKYKVDGRVSEKALDTALEVEKARANQRISDNSTWVTRMIRPLFAAPLIYYVWAIVIDSVHGDGTNVLAVPDFLQKWFGLIIVAYFGGRSFEKIAGSFLNRKK